ncbi:MAG: hypothetical protein RIR26_1764 [Pseudomonadota bacterium]|jgi:hypothetical protein
MKPFSITKQADLFLIGIFFNASGCGDGVKSLNRSQSIELKSSREKTPLSENSAADQLAKDLLAATVSTIGADETLQEIKRDPHLISTKEIQSTQSSSMQSVIYSVSPQIENSTTQTSTQTLSVPVFTPKALLLDASSLETILRPVFTTYGQFSTTDTRYFSPDEKQKLGEFSFFSVPNLVNPRIGGSISLSQDYIFAIRTFAGRACKNLVNAEKLTPSNVANRLINNSEWTSKKISVESISRFMTSVFGYAPLAGSFHSGAQDFATAFNNAVTAADGVSRTKDNAMFDNYILTCVYSVTDPRTFSR